MAIAAKISNADKPPQNTTTLKTRSEKRGTVDIFLGSGMATFADSVILTAR